MARESFRPLLRSLDHANMESVKWVVRCDPQRHGKPLDRHGFARDGRSPSPKMPTKALKISGEVVGNYVFWGATTSVSN